MAQTTILLSLKNVPMRPLNYAQAMHTRVLPLIYCALLNFLRSNRIASDEFSISRPNFHLNEMLRFSVLSRVEMVQDENESTLSLCLSSIVSTNNKEDIVTF